MRLAIFDIDGVLVRHSSELAFWRYLLRNKRQGPRQVAAYLLCLLRCLPVAGLHAGRMNKSYLAGLDRLDVEALGASFVGEWARDNWNHAAVNRLEAHHQCGDTVVLLSGTLEPLARALAEHLRVRHVVATLPGHRNGVYLADPPVVHPFATAKLVLAEKMVRELGFDWQAVTAYADAYYDLPLLEAAGEPVAVSPDRRLRKIALARGWEILEAEADARSTAKATRHP